MTEAQANDSVNNANTHPLISIITPTFNAAHTVKRTLDSVGTQTCKQYEHIIVDGKSTDNTVNIVEECGYPNLRFISEKDYGIYDAMNKGICMARGEYLIFLNAGDKFHAPDSLQLYADAIHEYNMPGIVYGQTILVDDNGKYIGPRHLKAPDTLKLASFKEGMVVCHQAMAVYHKIAGLYNLKYKYSSDYEWGIICLQRSKKNVALGKVTIDYLSEGATTTHHKESLKERFKIMCTYYGVIPTIIRHIGFAFRYIRRRRNAASVQ